MKVRKKLLVFVMDVREKIYILLAVVAINLAVYSHFYEALNGQFWNDLFDWVFRMKTEYLIESCSLGEFS